MPELKPRIPHTPNRDSVVAEWLKRCRDQYPPGCDSWYAVDDLLEYYRESADCGRELLG